MKGFFFTKKHLLKANFNFKKTMILGFFLSFVLPAEWPSSVVSELFWRTWLNFLHIFLTLQIVFLLDFCSSEVSKIIKNLWSIFDVCFWFIKGLQIEETMFENLNFQLSWKPNLQPTFYLKKCWFSLWYETRKRWSFSPPTRFLSISLHHSMVGFLLNILYEF